MPRTAKLCQGNWEKRLLMAVLWSYSANHSRRNGNIANWGSCIPWGSKEAMAPALNPLPAHSSSFLGQNGSAIFSSIKYCPCCSIHTVRPLVLRPGAFSIQGFMVWAGCCEGLQLAKQLLCLWNLNPQVLKYLSVSLCFERVFSGDILLGREIFS